MTTPPEDRGQDRGQDRGALLAKWCAENRQSVLWDPDQERLYDVYSGKELAMPVAKLSKVAERQEPEAGTTYLQLLLEDGRELALARPGIAFPPDVTNSGPLPGLPQVVCWRDFHAVAEQIQHVLVAHEDVPLSREVLDMVLYLIALIDGARAMGFEVGREERRIETYLKEAERRAGPTRGPATT